MLTKREEPTLAAAAALIGGLEPPELSAREASHAVRVALLASAGREKRRELHAGMLLALLAGSVALAATLGVSRPHTEPASATQGMLAPRVQTQEPSRLQLPTGDALTAAEGAQFEVQSALAERRQVKLHDGTMLFDVAPLGGGQRFEVVTPELQVRVLGTVFTVETQGGRSVVRVYEGNVEVRHQGRTLLLRVGDLFASDPRVPGHDSLAGEALAAAARRRELPAPVQIEVVQAPIAPALSASASGLSQRSASAVSDRQALPQSLQDGQSGSGLEAADAAIAERREPLGQWYLLRAELHGHAGRVAEAARDLELAAAYLPGREAQDAAYRAALLYFRQLRDGARALHVLKASGAVGPDKFVDARGLELRVQVLLSLDRPWEASAVARRYLRAYPESDAAAFMREVSDYSAVSLGTRRVGS